METVVRGFIQLIILGLFLSNSISWAESKDQEKANKKLSFNAMLMIQAQKVERGALIWPGPFVLPGIGVELYEQLRIYGPRLEWILSDKESSKELSLGFSNFGDGRPWIPLSQEDLSYRNKRSTTWEFFLNAKYKFGFRNLFHLGVFTAWAINEHQSFYNELLFGIPVFKFTSLETSLSIAPAESHQYLYGPEAVGGLGVLQTTLKYVLVKVPWEGVLIAKASYSYILLSENQKADYIRGQRHNFNSTLMAIWNFY